MATIVKLVANFQTQLGSKIAATDTSLTLLSNMTKDGVILPAGQYGFIINRGKSNEEYVIGTVSGLNVTSLTRGVSTIDGATGLAGLASLHHVGEPVEISEHPAIVQMLGIFNGTNQLNHSYPLTYDSAPTFSSPYQLITKAYADGLVSAGAPNADQTTKGLVEVATAAEINAGTATGGTGAALAVTADQLAASQYASLLTASTGFVYSFMGATAPTGYLICDGTAYGIATYPNLALVAGGQWGYGTLITIGSVDASTDTFTSTAHGLVNGDQVFLTSTNALPGGITNGIRYYVVNSATNTFKVSTTSGGTAVDLTGTGSGVISVTKQFRVPDLRGRMLIGAGTGAFTTTFQYSDVNTSNSQITIPANVRLYNTQAVAYTASGTAPTGLSTGTTYYVIWVDATHIQLASTLGNAINGTYISLTGQGTGGNTLTGALATRTLGEIGGEDWHYETLSELVTHHHTARMQSSGNTLSNNYPGLPQQDSTTGDTGGSQQRNIMSPFGTINWIVKT